MPVPAGAGIGVTLDHDFLGKVTVSAESFGPSDVSLRVLSASANFLPPRRCNTPSGEKATEDRPIS